MTGVWYPVGLLNALMGYDIGVGKSDIQAYFNPDIGKANCLDGESYYYGLDGQAPDTAVDMLSTAMHEMAHALGFGGANIDDSGEFNNISPDVFSHYVYDDVLKKRWTAMTGAERLASRERDGKLFWDGPNTTAVSSLAPESLCTDTAAGGRMRLYAPSPYDPGSSVSHFDEPCKPDLLMEPLVGSGPFLDVTPLLMADIGWTVTGTCGDGTPNDGEQCDQGAANGTAGASCSRFCLAKAAQTCGNGQLNGGEDCDEGAANGFSGSCCTQGCKFKPAGAVCRAANVASCDPAEVCSGGAATCPADVTSGGCTDGGTPIDAGIAVDSGSSSGGQDGGTLVVDASLGPASDGRPPVDAPVSRDAPTVVDARVADAAVVRDAPRDLAVDARIDRPADPNPTPTFMDASTTLVVPGGPTTNLISDTTTPACTCRVGDERGGAGSASLGLVVAAGACVAFLRRRRRPRG